MRNIFLLILFVTAFAYGQQYVEKQDVAESNILRNGGFENGLATYTVSGTGVLSIESGADKIFGNSSAEWLPSVAGAEEYVRTRLYNTSTLDGAKCEATIWYKTTESAFPYQFRVLNHIDSVIADSGPLPDSLFPEKATVSFDCTVDPLLLEVIAIDAGVTAPIYFDGLSLGVRKLMNDTEIVDALGFTPAALPIILDTQVSGVLDQDYIESTGVTSGTYTKVQVNDVGFVTSGTTLTPMDLPNSGVTSGTYTKVQVTSAGTVTSGTSLVASDIPSLDISKITTGVLSVTSGGTGTSTTTTGDLLVGSGTATFKKLGIGVDGQYLTIASGSPAWGTGAGASITVVTKGGSYTVLTTDSFIYASATTATYTLTLPAPASASALGKIFYFKRADQTLANRIIIAPASGLTSIDGVSNTTLATQYEQVALVSDGTNWLTVSRDYPQTQYTYSVAGVVGGLGSSTDEGTWWWRTGNCINIKATVVAGTVTATDFAFPLPSGLAIDSTGQASTTNSNSHGHLYNVSAGNPAFASVTGGPFVVFSDTANSVTHLYAAIETNTARFNKNDGNQVSGNSSRARIEANCVPIVGWK